VILPPGFSGARLDPDPATAPLEATATVFPTERD
jgi:hypothetical protein